MDQKEIKMLKIIEALENNNTHSQRELSRELNISLGLVNRLVRSVVRKGYFEINVLSKNKAKYLLTPKGMAEKSVLTYRYIQHSIYHYNYIRHKLSELIDDLTANQKKDIVLFGANELAEIVGILIKEHDINLIAIVDNDKAGSKLTGMTIVDSNFLRRNYFDALIITMLDTLQSQIDSVVNCGVNPNMIYFID